MQSFGDNLQYNYTFSVEQTFSTLLMNQKSRQERGRKRQLKYTSGAISS